MACPKPHLILTPPPGSGIIFNVGQGEAWTGFTNMRENAQLQRQMVLVSWSDAREDSVSMTIVVVLRAIMTDIAL